MSTFQTVFELKMNGVCAASSGGNKTFSFVFHYRLTSVPRPTPAQLITAFDNSIAPGIVTLLNVDYTGTTYDCRDMEDAFNQYVTVVNGQVGATTGDRLPMDMAVAMLYRSAERGRNFRGGKHFGPITEADTLKDELTAAKLTAWQTVAAALDNDLTDGTWNVRPIVFSPTLSQTRTNPTKLVGAEVTGVLVNKNIGTMRRRREKTVR